MKNINITFSLIAAVISMATANIANAAGLITIANPGNAIHTIEADGGCNAIENGPCIDVGDTGYTSVGYAPTLQVEKGRYLFTYIGDGDATYHNQFWLNDKLLFDNKTSVHLSNVDLKLAAGPVKFKYVFDIENNSGACPSGGCVLSNGTASATNGGSYFLGVHGSLSSTPATSEKEAWIGLSDRGDDDYQDLGVRVTSLDTEIDCTKHHKKHHHKSKKPHNDHNDGGKDEASYE
jgi:hypothetical protein